MRCNASQSRTIKIRWKVENKSNLETTFNISSTRKYSADRPCDILFLKNLAYALQPIFAMVVEFYVRAAKFLISLFLFVFVTSILMGLECRGVFRGALGHAPPPPFGQKRIKIHTKNAFLTTFLCY